MLLIQMACSDDVALVGSHNGCDVSLAHRRDRRRQSWSELATWRRRRDVREDG